MLASCTWSPSGRTWGAFARNAAKCYSSPPPGCSCLHTGHSRARKTLAAGFGGSGSSSGKRRRKCKDTCVITVIVHSAEKLQRNTNQLVPADKTVSVRATRIQNIRWQHDAANLARGSCTCQTAWSQVQAAANSCVTSLVCLLNLLVTT